MPDTSTSVDCPELKELKNATPLCTPISVKGLGRDAQATESSKLSWVDLPQVPSSRVSPKSTAYETKTYTALSQPVVAGIKQQEVETGFLQILDSKAARVLDTLHTRGLSNLTHDDISFWVHFVMSLKARTPEAVHLIKTRGPEHLEESLSDKPEEYDAIADTSDPTTLRDWTEKHFPNLIENFGMVSLDKFVLNRDIAQKLLRMTWWLWDFEGQKNYLLLSDRPCIFTAQIDDPDLVIALPISPWKAFMMTKSERVSDIMKSQRNEDLLMKFNRELAQSSGETHLRSRRVSSSLHMRPLG